MKQLVYKKNYISLDLVNEIRDYFNSINDSLSASKGPFVTPKHKLGWQGCWDRQLHFEKENNPIHLVIKKLKDDFGNFEAIENSCSIRYMSAPFLPHSDISSTDLLRTMRDNGYREGFIFLIPLWWREGYNPATVFFNSPANLNEPLYSDMLDILPNYSEEFKEESKNFSIRKIINWDSPGDLIAWENFQWHSSGQIGKVEYDKTTWVKEFISIDTRFKVES